VDVLGTHLGAALGDVAVTEPELLLRQLLAIQCVEWVHVELSDTHEDSRTREVLLVLAVVAHRVTGVLAQEALNALAEFLRALDVNLLHAVLAGLKTLGWLECRNFASLLVIERHVCDEVADHRERAQRRDGDNLGLLERVHARKTHETRTAIDLSTAGTALAGLAVPADREVIGLRCLEAVQDIEHDLTVVDLYVVVDERAGAVISAPEAELRHVSHVYACPLPSSWSSSSVMYLLSSLASNTTASSAGTRGSDCCCTSITSPTMRLARMTCRHWGLICG